MALGAGRGDVLRMVMTNGLRMAASGMTVGLAAALGMTRVLKTFLYEVETTDAATYLAVCTILGTTVFFATFLPARRAATVDPMTALRRE